MLELRAVCRYKNALTWIVAPLMLVLLVAICYRDAPQNVFHFDDGRNIARHPPVMVETLTIENVLNAGRESFLSTRPLPSMTFAVDWWRGGGAPAAFQYTNVSIHAGTAIAVFALLYIVVARTGCSKGTAGFAAFVAAALWASHPIQVQAVTYIVQRMAMMATFCTVLTVLLYILGRAQRGRRSFVFFAFALAFWILGMASKETAAIAPILVLLAEYGVIRHGQSLLRTGWDRALLAVPIIVGLIVVIDIWSGAGPLSARFLPGYDLRDFTLVERLLTQPRVILFHVSQILWPVPGRFSLEHDFPVSTGLLSPATTLAALGTLTVWCLAGAAALFRQRWRTFGFWLLWFPATLAIESSFIALEMVFEHRMYLASVGLAGLAALAMVRVPQWGRLHRLATFAVSTFVIVCLIWSTNQQVPVWQSTMRMAQNNLEHAPNKARSWANNASVLQTAGRSWDEIMPSVTKALELDPNEFVASHIKAMYLISAGQLAEASDLLDRLSLLAERDHSVINTIGMLRLAQRDYSAAIASFEKVVRLDDFKPEFKYNLALSYELAGRCNEALATWRAYLLQAANAQRITSVRQRLERNFWSEGGRCFGETS